MNIYSGKGRPKKVLINGVLWTFRLKASQGKRSESAI
jgi:hypothetical protein